MRQLEEKIGYTFNDKKLLLTALTHSSYANERQSEGASCYERLEFLRDSVLGAVTANFLYSYKPELPEGRMTRLRAELVCEGSLHSVAMRLGLGDYMRLGKGEEHTGGRQRPSIMADMVESIIAAMYLDGGLEPAKRFIHSMILDGAVLDDSHPSADYKTALQELVQQKSGSTIAYELIDQSGPDHNKIFTFRVSVNGEPVGEGSGRTKKEAEQMAACRALEALKK